MISIKRSSRFVVVFYIFSQSTIASPPLWVWSNLRTMYIICHGLQRSHPRGVIGSLVSKVPCPLLPQHYHSSHIIEDWIKFWVGKCALQTLKTVISQPTLKWDKRWRQQMCTSHTPFFQNCDSASITKMGSNAEVASVCFITNHKTALICWKDVDGINSVSHFFLSKLQLLIPH